MQQKNISRKSNGGIKMIVEGIVTAISLENMGSNAESVFVLTLEIVGSNGTKLKFPIDRLHAANYQLGQTVRYSIEALEVEIYKNRGPENYERRYISPEEEEIEKMANEYEDDEDESEDDDYEEDYDEDGVEDEEDYASRSTLESVLNDRSDEMSDEEIAQKVGKTEQAPSEPAIAPKVEDTEIKNLTESEYRAQTTSTESNSKTPIGEENDQIPDKSTELSVKDEQTKVEVTTEEANEPVAPIGMMGGYPDTEDVYDEEDDDE